VKLENGKIVHVLKQGKDNGKGVTMVKNRKRKEGKNTHQRLSSVEETERDSGNFSLRDSELRRRQVLLQEAQ